MTYNPVLMAYIEEQQRMAKQQNLIANMQSSLDPIMMSPPYEGSRRDSCSSICSEDFVAMHIGMLSPSPLDEKIEPIQLTSHPSKHINNKSSTHSPPFLSTSTSAATSPASSHGDLLSGTPVNFTYELSVCEKLSSILATTANHPLVHNNHSLPHLRH